MVTAWLPTLAGRPGPRYRAIAEALAEDIDHGALAPNDRLPTHRDLAYRLGVTVGTVTRAYVEAERRGLIAGEVGRGTFVRDQKRPLRELEMVDPVGPEMIDLSRSAPVLGAEETVLAEALVAVAKGDGFASLLGYQPHAGMAAHRQAAARWLSGLGLEVPAEGIVIANGGQNAMALALAAATRRGDTVLAEQLTYPGMKALASHAELRLHPVAIDDEGVIPDALDAACRATAARALYLMPTVHNPTTSIMLLERRRRIVEVARRHGLLLIEDDVYGFLAEPSPPPLASLAPELTFYLTSLSKSLAPGLRIGYVVPPPARLDHTIGAARATQWMASPLPAAIATHLIESGQAHAIAEGHRAEARARQRIARDVLGNQPIVTYRNAFHIWLALPEPWRRDEFVWELRRRGVLVTSADAFAVGRGPTPHAVRVCLGGTVRSRSELEMALKKIALLLAGRDRPHLSIV